MMHLAIALFITLGQVFGVTPLSDTLYCADRTTFLIRKVTQSEGCAATEKSLGRGAITAENPPRERLHPKLLLRFKAASTYAKEKGINLYIASGYRTLERQEYLFDKAIEKYGSETEAAKWVLPPYVSRHPMGLAMDVNYPNDRRSAKWLEKNGWKFGLCRVFENEWWHFEAPIAPGEKCPPRLANARELLDR